MCLFVVFHHLCTIHLLFTVSSYPSEHMLFLGTDKYPDEKEYGAFISANGGYTNAWTGSENTNYHFNVNWPHLEPALDRFAQFFISPLFTASATDREMQAVDSEHAKVRPSFPSSWPHLLHRMFRTTCGG